MICDSKVLALIPARGGSKGLPDKNIRLLAGRTLLEYAARAASASGVVDRIVLSTDSERIAAEGRRIGVDVPFIRPRELAGDATPMLPVVEHAVDALEQGGWRPDIVVLLQPTSPLRQAFHIKEAAGLMKRILALLLAAAFLASFAGHSLAHRGHKRVGLLLRQECTQSALAVAQDVYALGLRHGRVRVEGHRAVGPLLLAGPARRHPVRHRHGHRRRGFGGWGPHFSRGFGGWGPHLKW